MSRSRPRLRHLRRDPEVRDCQDRGPDLFQVNGPVGYQNWKKYTADMSNTDVYKELTNQDVALKDGDKVVGVPYVMEPTA